MKELTTLNNKFTESEVKKENKFSHSVSMSEFLIKKVAGYYLIKKKFQDRCFPVNYEKFLRTPILKNFWK